MPELHESQIETLHKNSQAANQDDMHAYLNELSGWRIESVAGINQLVKQYTFDTFVSALDFTNKVAALAEEFNHHPALLTEWGKTTVRWWTHSVGGLHKNDFIMAARTEKL